MDIIIKNKSRPSVKGRSVSEFCDNLVSEGWPSEFTSEEARDRARFIEKREGRTLRKSDLQQISKDMKPKR